VSPNEVNIVRALVAVAWADGRMEAAEAGVIEGLLSGFDASPEEEAAILEFARKRRTLEQDVPVAELAPADRELLFSNAALLVCADGVETDGERQVLKRLAELLELSAEVTRQILQAARTSFPPRRS